MACLWRLNVWPLLEGDIFALARGSDAAVVARRRYGCLTPWQRDPARYGSDVVSGRFSGCEDGIVATLSDLLPDVRPLNSSRVHLVNSASLYAAAAGAASVAARSPGPRRRRRAQSRATLPRPTMVTVLV